MSTNGQDFLSTDHDAIMKEIDHCLTFDNIAPTPWGLFSDTSVTGRYELCDSSGSTIYTLSIPEGSTAVTSAERASARRIIQSAMPWVNALKNENLILHNKLQGLKDAISEISDVCTEYSE